MFSYLFSKISGPKSTEDVEAKLNDKDSPQVDDVSKLDGSPTLFWESVMRAEGPMTVPATPETYGGGFFGGAFANLDNFFRVTDRGSTLLTEFNGMRIQFLN